MLFLPSKSNLFTNRQIEMLTKWKCCIYKEKVSCLVLTKTECKVLQGNILYISMVNLQHVSVQLLISITVLLYGISISVFCKYSDLQITRSTFLFCIIVMTFQLRRASRDAQGRLSERKALPSSAPFILSYSVQVKITQQSARA